MCNENHLPPTSEKVRVALAVVVPCHNVGDTLSQQLDALVDERWSRPWTIVVVDNNSTDDTASTGRRYEGRGVRVISANGGWGVSYARNAGVRAVDSELVAFCDGDDVIHPGWVSSLGDALQHADIVGGANETRSLNPDWLAESRPNGRSNKLPTFGQLEFAPGGNSGMRREVFEELGGYDENFVGLEDIEFSLRATAAGAKLVYSEGVTIAYRYREGLRSLWRQGFFYGRGRPALIKTARDLGLPSPSRIEGVRSWAWLIIRLPLLRNRAGRYQWVWVLANRMGVLRGAVALRSLYV